MDHAAAGGGWHPDPYRRTSRRYWDGQRWTHHVVDHEGRQYVDDPTAGYGGAFSPYAAGHGVVIQNVVNAQPAYVVPIGQKSKGVAFALTFFFGPLGMFYSTVSGALIMLVISIIVVPLTLGVALLVTWPICMIWGVSAVDSANRAHVVGMAPLASIPANYPSPSFGAVPTHSPPPFASQPPPPPPRSQELPPPPGWGR